MNVRGDKFGKTPLIETISMDGQVLIEESENEIFVRFLEWGNGWKFSSRGSDKVLVTRYIGGEKYEPYVEYPVKEERFSGNVFDQEPVELQPEESEIIFNAFLASPPQWFKTPQYLKRKNKPVG